MIDAITTSLAGMQAAEKRLGVAANNIANMNSTGDGPGQAYHAQEAVQTSQGGAPRVTVREANPPTSSIYAPSLSSADENGVVEVPNVNLAAELVDTKLAQHSYRASAMMIRAASEMHETLLDTFA